MRSFFPSASQVLLSRVQGKASAARIPAKSAGFVTPSWPEEKPFLEAAEVSCSAQCLGPPATLAPLPQPQRLVVPDCAPRGYQAEMPLASTGQAKAMWSFFLWELAVPTAPPCTLLPDPPKHTELCISWCILKRHKPELPILSPTYAPQHSSFLLFTQKVLEYFITWQTRSLQQPPACKMCMGTSFLLSFLFLKILFLSAFLASSVNKTTIGTWQYGMYFFKSFHNHLPSGNTLSIQSSWNNVFSHFSAC